MSMVVVMAVLLLVPAAPVDLVVEQVVLVVAPVVLVQLQGPLVREVVLEDRGHQQVQQQLLLLLLVQLPLLLQGLLLGRHPVAHPWPDERSSGILELWCAGPLGLNSRRPASCELRGGTVHMTTTW